MDSILFIFFFIINLGICACALFLNKIKYKNQKAILSIAGFVFSVVLIYNSIGLERTELDSTGVWQTYGYSDWTFFGFSLVLSIYMLFQSMILLWSYGLVNVDSDSLGIE